MNFNKPLNLKRSWFRFSLGAAVACAFLAPIGLRAAGCGAIKLDATDAVAAEPVAHKVILENDTVRVLEATIPMHGKEVPHTHFWPSVFFEQTSPVNEPWKTVNIRWSAGGPAKGYESSERDRHNLLIELKNVDCQPVPAPELPTTDPVTIHDPNITVALENPYVRVLSVRVPPGEKEPWHTHTWPAVVVYFRLPPSQRLTQDGKKIPRAELKEMQVTFDSTSQPLHSIENLGTVAYQAYRVEIKPTTRIALATPYR
jgi:hypothetical protein